MDTLTAPAKTGSKIMYFYVVYGLQVQSEIVLPWLHCGGTGTDVTIRLGITPMQLQTSCAIKKWGQVKEDEILLIDERAGRIWVRPGVIVVSTLDDVDTNILVPLILGSGLAAQLIWRNYFVLHASAIRLPNGNAIAFSGAKKAGKSTIAGFLYHHGHALVSDDVCPLFFGSDPASDLNTLPVNDGDSHPVRIQPGFPRIKLDPAILTALGKNPEDYSLLPLKFRIKHSYPAHAGFNATPTTLQAIYFLEEGEITQIKQLSIKDAIFQLMHQNFRPLFLASRAQQQKALATCTKIANQVAIFTLIRPKKIAHALATIETLLDSLPNRK